MYVCTIRHHDNNSYRSFFFFHDGVISSNVGDCSSSFVEAQCVSTT